MQRCSVTHNGGHIATLPTYSTSISPSGLTSHSRAGVCVVGCGFTVAYSLSGDITPALWLLLVLVVLRKCFVLSTFSFEMARFIAPIALPFHLNWVCSLVIAPRCSKSFSHCSLLGLRILLDIPF